MRIVYKNLKNYQNLQFLQVMTPAQYNEYQRQADVIDQAKIWKKKQMTDKIVQQVIDKFNQRSEVGIKKYGTTLEQNNNDDFLNHLQEELMDAILYIEKLKSIKSNVGKTEILHISDEQIETIGESYRIFYNGKEGNGNLIYKHYIEGIKWYREKLKQQ